MSKETVKMPENVGYVRPSKRRGKAKRSRRKIGLLVVIGLLLAGLAAGVIVQRHVERKAAAALNGTFVIGATEYEFDGRGSGCLHVEDAYHYAYTYKIRRETLRINYKAAEVHDAVYTFSLDGDTLTLIGGEGTAGGTYELQRKT